MSYREKVSNGLEKCKKTLCEKCPYNYTVNDGKDDICGMNDMLNDALELLKEIKKPKFLVREDGTIEPLPQIVRCKDCKNGRRITEGFYDCDIVDFTYVHESTWFCACGERAE